MRKATILALYGEGDARYAVTDFRIKGRRVTFTVKDVWQGRDPPVVRQNVWLKKIKLQRNGYRAFLVFPRRSVRTTLQ